jgi:urease accessory protein
VASAHPGHGTPDFAAGLIHPLTGIDHLLAMVAVGWWSAATQTRRWWLIPAAFAGGTLLGALAGLAGLVLPATEAAIAASLVVLGALMLFKQRLSLPAAVLLAGGLALFHGYAHGHEMSPSIDALSWLGGMVVATLGLHLSGAALGLAMRSRPWVLQAAGSAVALVGAMLLLMPSSL